MDWRRELINKWLWHAFHGFEQSELAGGRQKSADITPTGFIDKAQLKLLTAHIGHSLGKHNSGKITPELEKHFDEKEGKINFKDYLEFLHTHTFLEPDHVDLQKLEESCWSLCQRTYDDRVSRVLDIKQAQRIWKLFNFLAEPDDFPVEMLREEAEILMEKLILGTGNRWQSETFEYKTIGIKTFSFLKVMACFESNYVKGMDRLCVDDSVENLYDELIEDVEKKGWMHKKGHKMANWKHRWFILKPDGIYYYTDKNLKTKKGFVPLSKEWSAESIPDQSNAKYKNLFFIHKTAQVGKEKMRYDMSAPDPRSRAEWISALQAVMTKESGHSNHRIALEERRKKRKEIRDREEADNNRLMQENLDKMKKQQEIDKLNKEKEEALKRLQESKEEARKRVLLEKQMREREQEERQKTKAEIERLKAAREKDLKEAEGREAEILAKELEEQERQLREQEEREKQKEDLDRLQTLYEEQVKLRELEKAVLAEQEEALKVLNKLLQEERDAKLDEQRVRELQARLLQEEADRRKELEKLKEEQENKLKDEINKRKGLEQQSEELTKIQMEQAEELRIKQAKLLTLADERKSADSQLQHLQVKLADVQKHREEQELEKKRKESELEQKKTELEKRKQAQREELDKRTKNRLATTVGVKTGVVRSHRGDGVFIETEFDLIKEIRAREKKLAMSRKKSLSASMAEEGEILGEANGDVFETPPTIEE